MGGILQLARALEPFDLYWLEADGFDPDALLAAREQTRTRMAHGKALVGRRAFRPFLERHVTDVIALETLSTGLSEARRIADLAAHYDAMVSPANHMGPLSSLIAAHLGAVMPNVEIMELDGADVPSKWQLIDHPPRIEQGELVVPDRPGWGADIVEEEVARNPLRDPARPGPSPSRHV
jgi:L-alanine-DL-glutamate epimerase-like enolase superfamily enzyme